MAEYAKPCALAIAGIAADVPAERRDYLAGVARDIFVAACEPYDELLEAASQRATQEAARHFQGAPPIHMQMFIAMTNSFAALLGNALSALIEHPAQAARLREQPDLLPSAMDELLRSPAWRGCNFAVVVEVSQMDAPSIRRSGCSMIEVANRDPEHFAQPHELRLDRRPAHLALGTGIHAWRWRGCSSVSSDGRDDQSAARPLRSAGQPVAVPVEVLRCAIWKFSTVVQPAARMWCRVERKCVLQPPGARALGSNGNCRGRFRRRYRGVSAGRPSVSVW